MFHRVIPLLLLLHVSSVFVHAQQAAAADDLVQVSCQLQRHNVVIARDSDNQPTVAASVVYGLYGDGTLGNWEANTKSIAEQCAELEGAAWWSCPECLALEEFRRRKAGDIQGRSQLFEPGFSRRRSIERASGTPAEISAHLAPFDRVLLLSKVTWGPYVIISTGMVGEEKWFPWPVYAKKVGDKYWLTEDIHVNSLIQPFLGVLDVEHPKTVAELPQMRRAINVYVDPDDPIEENEFRSTADLNLVFEEVAQDGQYPPRAFILFLNDEPLQAEGPLLSLEPASLSPPVRALHEAALLYKQEDLTQDEALQVWAGDSRDYITRKWGRVLPMGYKLNSVLPFSERITLERSVSVDDKLIWYGHTPKLVGEGDRQDLLFQQRENGQWLLFSRVYGPHPVLSHPEVRDYFFDLRHEE